MSASKKYIIDLPSAFKKSFNIFDFAFLQRNFGQKICIGLAPKNVTTDLSWPFFLATLVASVTKSDGRSSKQNKKVALV